MTAKAKSDEEFNSGKKTVADLKETGKKKEERISVLKEKIEAMQRRKQELKRQQDLLIKEAAEENKKMEEKVPE